MFTLDTPLKTRFVCNSPLSAIFTVGESVQVTERPSKSLRARKDVFCD